MIIKFNDISKNATAQAEHGKGIRVLDPLLVNEERTLNFELLELLDFAEIIMNKDDKAPDKWIGVKGLLRQMQDTFPYLITPDTCLKLIFEEERYGQRTECLGVYNYRQFIKAMGSPEELEKIHEHIVNNYNPIKLADTTRETLYAEDKLLLLYSALKYELNRHDRFDGLFVQGGSGTSDEWKQTKKPHFGMKDNESGQVYWDNVYLHLINAKWIWGNEVKSGEWVYICCGKQTVPAGTLVWHGSTAALASIVRHKFNGQWHIAHQIFSLPNGKALPATFNSTNEPCQKVRTQIENIFSSR